MLKTKHFNEPHFLAPKAQVTQANNNPKCKILNLSFNRHPSGARQSLCLPPLRKAQPPLGNPPSPPHTKNSPKPSPWVRPRPKPTKPPIPRPASPPPAPLAPGSPANTPSRTASSNCATNNA